MELYDIYLARQLGGGGGITPTGTKNITANGDYDVTSYANASVSVPASVPNIQSLSITENGTYTASGNVDGYSPINVNVSGGSGGGNFVTGTFTVGSTPNVKETVNIPYDGNGYPVAGVIVVDGGMMNNTASGQVDWYNSTVGYCVGFVAFAKCDTSLTPLYDGNNVSANYATLNMFQKKSSGGASYDYQNSKDARFYTNSVNGSGYSCLALTGNKEISYMVCNNTSSSRGLLSGIRYRYYIVYSE